MTRKTTVVSLSHPIRSIFILPLIGLTLIGTLAGIRLLQGQNLPLFTGSLRPAPNIKVIALSSEEPPMTWPDDFLPPRLVNFWASWCAPCALEHPLLMELASQNIPIDGIAYKDSVIQARLVLERDGNPYARSGHDPTGEAGLAFGIIGVPETFLLNRKGQIIHVYRGPLDRGTLQQIVSLINHGFQHPDTKNYSGR